MNGERLRQARENAGLNQSALGKCVGLSQSMIGALERGEREASLENVRRLAEALNLPDHLWLLEDFTRNDPDSIVADPTAPPGLKQLANDRVFAASANIQPTEWQALRSIELPSPATKDGYSALLFTIRLITGYPAPEVRGEK